jgi:dTDP-4-dehydrorhamnose 3,5-epimerase
MKVLTTPLEGVVIIEPNVFKDPRGFFMETYHQSRYTEAGIGDAFVQDNLSQSIQGTLRGLHYQFQNAQAKLVQVIQGEIYDVAVDIRHGSPTFGQWVGITLSQENQRQLYISKGFAHGFCVCSETVTFMYKCSDVYNPGAEGGIHWSDPDLGIDWPVEAPLLSEKDAANSCLKDVPKEKLPVYEGKL